MIRAIFTDEHGSQAQAVCPPEPVAEEPDDLVTIAIPTYNRADGFLAATLESALAQTHPHIEVIVADNCSTDHTGDVVRSFKDPRISYDRHSSNIGLYRNLNFCIERARGRFFCLLCDDDLMDPDFVETCLKQAQYAGECGLIQTGTRIIDADSKVLSEAPNRGGGGGGVDFIGAWFGNRTNPYLCSTMFLTKALRDVGGFEIDNTLCDVRAEFHVARRFGWRVVEDVKAGFRHHDGKYTHVETVRSWCRDSGNLLREMLSAVEPADRSELAYLGKRMLTCMNYRRAAHVEHFGWRVLANFTVMREFGIGVPKAINSGIRTKWRRIWKNNQTCA